MLVTLAPPAGIDAKLLLPSPQPVIAWLATLEVLHSTDKPIILETDGMFHNSVFDTTASEIQNLDTSMRSACDLTKKYETCRLLGH